MVDEIDEVIVVDILLHLDGHEETWQLQLLEGIGSCSLASSYRVHHRLENCFHVMYCSCLRDYHGVVAVDDLAD
jgi:hypothetical protein